MSSFIEELLIKPKEKGNNDNVQRHEERQRPPKVHVRLHRAHTGHSNIKTNGGKYDPQK